MKGEIKQLDLFDAMFNHMVLEPPKERFESGIVEYMHEGVLEQSLNTLSDPRSSQSNKEEIIEWLNSPFSLEPAPFSFQACCLCIGVSPEDMQQSVNRFLNGQMYGQRTMH